MTMVPLKAGFLPGSAGGAGVGGGAGGAAGDGGAGRGGAAGAPPGVFIMSIVPLNFGAAAPLRLKPHFVQAVAVSGFWVPQFGQNTPHLRRVLDEPFASVTEARAAYTSPLPILKRKMNFTSSKLVSPPLSPLQ